MSPITQLTQVASGRAVAPGAGATICTLSHTVLPAGFYNIDVESAVSGNAAADIGNLEFFLGANPEINPVESGVNGQPSVESLKEIQLDGNTDLIVKAIGAGTAGVVYEAEIKATRVG